LGAFLGKIKIEQMKKLRFEEFKASAKSDWESQALRDLKGKDWDQTLRWKSAGGILVEPFYDHENLPESAQLEAIRQAQTNRKTAGWANAAWVKISNERIDNDLINKHISQGATSIYLDFDRQKWADFSLSKLLHGIKLSDVPVFFVVSSEAPSLLDELSRIAPYQWRGGILDTALNDWLQSGFWPEKYFQNQVEILSKIQNHPHFLGVPLSLDIFQQAGAHIVQELAFGLSLWVEILHQSTQLGAVIDTLVARTHLSLGIGTNYFHEIAKLRALRFLSKQVTQHFQAKNTAIYVLAKSSTLHHAHLTPNTNMLRNTTEAMSAAIGSADAICLANHEAENSFGDRISLNISTILQEESYLDKTADIAAGSYYLERLTLDFVEQAWALFQEVEQKGGFLKAFEEGFIQKKIQENIDQVVKDLQDKSRIMVGVNQYRFDEQAPLTAASNNESKSQTKYPVLKPIRLSDFFS
jgi:methylmalonyl-CoA mutase